MPRNVRNGNECWFQSDCFIWYIFFLYSANLVSSSPLLSVMQQSDEFSRFHKLFSVLCRWNCSSVESCFLHIKARIWPYSVLALWGNNRKELMCSFPSQTFNRMSMRRHSCDKVTCKELEFKASKSNAKLPIDSMPFHCAVISSHLGRCLHFQFYFYLHVEHRIYSLFSDRDVIESSLCESASL